ncbi:hypothetical protein F7018_12315 [Tenacibaculum aiptasiae]|uniref:Uncharacterized protein n=1 Tax=Tenacibaculum aiptasiae TaxID=426481 RepID=A0A7J5ACJ9_9FLAO|nr:hypothetical protein [Tenacibaculum aiptasiae]KAB1155255.1 hypothetical protein F7018_12315 [Tenacibaculum aiptasiae]
MKPQKEKRISDYDTTGELGFNEMIGAIFYMFLGRLTKDYKYYHQLKFQKKNIITGYFLKLFIVFGSIILFYFLLF